MSKWQEEEESSKVENQPVIYDQLKIAIKTIEEKKYCPLMISFLKDGKALGHEVIHHRPISVKDTKELLTNLEGLFRHYWNDTFLIIFQRRGRDYLVVNIFTTNDEEVGGIIPFIRSGESVKCDEVEWDKDEEIQGCLRRMAQTCFTKRLGQDKHKDLEADL